MSMEFDEVIRRLRDCDKTNAAPAADLVKGAIEAIDFLEGFSHDLQKIIGCYETAIYRNLSNVVPTEETVRIMLDEIDCGRAMVAKERRELDDC